MLKPKGNFANCIDCKQYAPVDFDGRCPICENRAKELLQTAQKLVKDNPKLTRDDLVEKLQVEVNVVDVWIKSGKIRCNALKSHCPNCGSAMFSFTCEVCKYNAASALKSNFENSQKKIPPKMHTQRAERYNRDRKRNSSFRNN